MWTSTISNWKYKKYFTVKILQVVYHKEDGVSAVNHFYVTGTLASVGMVGNYKSTPQTSKGTPIPSHHVGAHTLMLGCGLGYFGLAIIISLHSLGNARLCVAQPSPFPRPLRTQIGPMAWLNSINPNPNWRILLKK